MKSFTLSILFVFVICCVFGQTLIAHENNGADKLLDQTTARTLRSLVTFGNETEQINYWRTLMPERSQPATQEIVFSRLPESWIKHQVAGPQETSLLATIDPLLISFNKSYRVVVVEYNKPVLIIDSDAVLIASTELLKISTKDEILGLVAHEIAHSIFVSRSIQIKAGLKTRQRDEAIKNLALIELFCDTIAAYTIKSMRRDPLAFLKLVVRAEKTYPAESLEFNYHPTGEKRLKLVGEVLSSIN